MLVIVVSVLFALAGARGSHVQGYWPSAGDIIVENSVLTGIVLAAAAAWDAGHRSTGYTTVTAVSRARAARLILGPPVLWGLVALAVGTATVVAVVLSVHTGGTPWWELPVSAAAWTLLCAVTGTATGATFRRPVVATVVAPIIVIILAAASSHAKTTAVLPRLVDLPNGSDALITRTPQTGVAVLTTLTALAVTALLATALTAHPADTTPARRLTPTVTAAAVVAVLAAGTALTPLAAHGRPATNTDPRSTTTATAVCTRTVDGARFCSWPEDTHLIDQVDRHWDPFITTLSTAGLPVPPGTYGHTGSGHEHEVTAGSMTPSSVLEAVYRSVADTVSASDEWRSCPNSRVLKAADQVLAAWAVYANREPGDPSGILASNGTELPARDWVERDLTHRSPEEQGRALAPYVDALVHCGDTLPPIPTPDDPAPGAGEVTR
ncbi:hypothetical protein [Corynebacterium bovis]|uniref:hypothetical protein n=1 Tax=Corynebacterium bovis TaxID=36808 RepID=UPI000F6470C1|nr:hypothetical protein [Corynebacterium bovis]